MSSRASMSAAEKDGEEALLFRFKSERKLSAAR